MIVLCGSFVSISPCTLPRISSNGPAAPTACPLFMGSREVISRLMTCARAVVALEARMQATRSERTRVGLIRYLQVAQQRAPCATLFCHAPPVTAYRRRDESMRPLGGPA